jgi:hypothetical protein
MSELTQKQINTLRKQDAICEALQALSDAIDTVTGMDKRVKNKINERIRAEPYADFDRISKIIWDVANEVKFHGRAQYQKSQGLI